MDKQSWTAQLMIQTIGFHKAEESLTLQTLYSPLDALKVGLVDKVVHSDLVLETSYGVASQYTKIPPQARFGSKMLA